MGMRTRYVIGAALIALIVVPVGLNLNAELQARALCRDQGGLIVTAELPKVRDRLVTETRSSLFSPSDPLYNQISPSTVQHDLGRWPPKQEAFLSCMESSICIAAIQFGGPSYVVLRGGEQGAYAVDSGSEPCRNGEAAGDREISVFATQQGRTVRFCKVPAPDFAKLIVISKPIWTKDVLSPFEGYLQVRAWRVFSYSNGKELAKYNQLGTESVLKKMLSIPMYMVGAYSDYTGNRCRGPKNIKTHDITNADIFFSSSRDYPIGRYNISGS